MVGNKTIYSVCYGDTFSAIYTMHSKHLTGSNYQELLKFNVNMELYVFFLYYSIRDTIRKEARFFADLYIERPWY